MSEDTKLQQLIINTLSPEQFEPITPSETEIYLVEDDAEYATVEELATKQDKLIVGNGIDIINNKISTNTQFVITEDMFDIEYDATKGEAPYSADYGYTNITIHEDAGVDWIEGAVYSFVLDTKVSKSANRNCRIRIGEEGDWKPIMVTSGVASGSTVFVKAINNIFFYKTTYQPDGALHCLYDTNTTYTLNYMYDAGKYKAGSGTCAVDRYTLIMQKPDMTWEKITATNAKYSTGTTKKVNTNGFILNQIKYYRYTTTYANGAYIGANYLCSQIDTFNSAYSFNCTTTPGWTVGQYIYLVGTVKADGLFYLDTTKWWDTVLPTEADGKIYIQLGSALTTTDATMTFLNDRPIIYHDGTGIKQYIPNDTTKQDVITDLATIRDGASKGATALQTIPIAKANVVGGVAGGNWLTVNQTTGKMECGELTYEQYSSANGYTFISKTTLENVLTAKGYITSSYHDSTKQDTLNITLLEGAEQW